MTRVTMDTNALMMPVECDVRVFDELSRILGAFEAVVPRAVCDELEKLSAGNGQEAVAASVGADLARDRCTVVDHEEPYADDAVLEVGADCDCVVTNDGPLRTRLLAAGIPVISLRGRTKLELTQP